MSMKTINTYTYHELSDNAKVNALRSLQDINTDHAWYEHIIDEWKEKLEDRGFNRADISFSGFYSQGDGCSFKADIDLDKLAIDKGIINYTPLLANREDFHITCEPIHGWSAYCMHNLQYSGCCSTDDLDTLLEDFVDYLICYKAGLENEIYDDLQKDYEYLTSDEAIIETIDCNDMHFLEDGRLA
jgi:hypothetical protein